MEWNWQQADWPNFNYELSSTRARKKARKKGHTFYCT